MARLCVLCEDLKIEYRELKKSDPYGHEMAFYLRRCVATLCEVDDEARKLDKDQEFAGFKKGFQPIQDKVWSDARQHFNKYFRKKGGKLLFFNMIPEIQPTRRLRLPIASVKPTMGD